MTRTRIFTLGCLGAIVLVIALCVIVTAVLRAPFGQARSRWDVMGSENYTLVVREFCACPNRDEFRITVESGRVTDAERVIPFLPDENDASNSKPEPSEFDHMTVEAALERAGRAQDRLWMNFTPLVEFEIAYDPTYGYVTTYKASTIGIGENFYEYAAHDLAIAGP